MRVAAGIDQLRITRILLAARCTLPSTTWATLTPHRSAQIACKSAPILHHRGAADHFQVGDSRKGGQNLVLHAIGKVSVCFSSLRFSNGNTAIDFSVMATGATELTEVTIGAREPAANRQRKKAPNELTGQ